MDLNDNTMVAFTGHRPQSMSIDEARHFAQELPRIVDLLVRQHGVLDFRSGMALGVDLLGASLVAQAHGRLHCVIPVSAAWQTAKWQTASDRRRHAALVRYATTVTVVPPVVNELGAVNPAASLMARNEALFEGADLAVVSWNGSRRGGTWDALRRIVTLDITTILIMPGRETVLQPGAKLGLAHKVPTKSGTGRDETVLDVLTLTLDLPAGDPEEAPEPDEAEEAGAPFETDAAELLEAESI